MNDETRTQSGAPPQALPWLTQEEYCPVCQRPDHFCEVCGGPHDPSRPHARVAGEVVRFTHEDVAALNREADAWEGSLEYESVQGIRAHAALLRSIATRLELLVPLA